MGAGEVVPVVVLEEARRAGVEGSVRASESGSSEESSPLKTSRNGLSFLVFSVFGSETSSLGTGGDITGDATIFVGRLGVIGAGEDGGSGGSAASLSTKTMEVSVSWLSFFNGIGGVSSLRMAGKGLRDGSGRLLPLSAKELLLLLELKTSSVTCEGGGLRSSGGITGTGGAKAFINEGTPSLLLLLTGCKAASVFYIADVMLRFAKY
jgi:hypothetical protein